MSYEINMLDDQAAVLITFTADFNVAADIPALNVDLKPILDSADTSLTFLIDLRLVRLDFSAMVAGLAAGTRGSDLVLDHPNINRTVFITDSGLMKIGTKALSQTQYGSLHVTVVDTLEEALASIEV